MTGAFVHPARLWGKKALQGKAAGRRWHGVAVTFTCQKKHMGSVKHLAANVDDNFVIESTCGASKNCIMLA